MPWALWLIQFVVSAISGGLSDGGLPSLAIFAQG